MHTKFKKAMSIKGNHDSSTYFIYNLINFKSQKTQITSNGKTIDGSTSSPATAFPRFADRIHWQTNRLQKMSIEKFFERIHLWIILRFHSIHLNLATLNFEVFVETRAWKSWKISKAKLEWVLPCTFRGFKSLFIVMHGNKLDEV